MAEVDTTVRPDNESEATQTSPSWAVSLCFWSALLIAAVVYASVALAPKLSVWNNVRYEYQTNMRQLVALEEDVEYLERVEVALETDPEFVQRLAGVSRPQHVEGEELIPVSGSLLFGQSDESIVALTTAPGEPPYNAAITRLATDRRLRTILLLFAACLTIFAFAFLNEAGRGFVYSTAAILKATAMLPVKRYFSASETSSLDATPSNRPLQ